MAARPRPVREGRATTVELHGVPVVPWTVNLIPYRQGDHLTLIGPTGSGKSVLARDLIARRRFAAIAVTKVRDSTWADLRWPMTRTWPPPRDGRWLVWPTSRDPDQLIARQRFTFDRMLADAFARGGYTILLDEVRHVSERLGLKGLCETLWLQGRSLGVGLVSCSQRPVWIPSEAVSQARWLVTFRTRDGRDVRRLAEASGHDGERIEWVVGSLPPHAFVAVERDGPGAFVSRLPYRPGRGTTNT